MTRHLLPIVLLLLFNTAIAVLVSVINPQYGLLHSLVISQCIGICVALINTPIATLINTPGWRRWLIMAVTLPGSVFLGITIAFSLLGWPLTITPQIWASAVVGLMFAVIGSVVFLLAERVHLLDAEVRQRRLAEAERAQGELQAHLKLLQAQIEPHFLFNTLANVASLMETDVPRARRLLDRLNDWLRIALARSRGHRIRLGDELVLLENWLEILAVRFGPRLSWQLDVDDQARDCPLPPMLLQPLLENAVIHGIEPKVGGGRIQVTGRVRDGMLRLEVRDDGIGLDAASSGTGTGLANVRDRLAALYGTAGHLELGDNPEGGVTVRLELPCAP